jgi:hypothetical protein
MRYVTFSRAISMRVGSGHSLQRNKTNAKKPLPRARPPQSRCLELPPHVEACPNPDEAVHALEPVFGAKVMRGGETGS